VVLCGSALLFRKRLPITARAIFSGGLALLLSALVGGLAAFHSNSVVLNYGGKEVTFSAKAADIFMQEENRCGILLSDCRLPNGEKGSAVVYGFGDFTCREGETVLVTATVQDYLPTDSQRGRGADFVATLQSLERTEKPSEFWDFINNLYKHGRFFVFSSVYRSYQLFLTNNA